MLEQSVITFCNNRSYGSRDGYALQGHYVHHYVYISHYNHRFAATTHCHITGGSQSREFGDFASLRNYLLSFEPMYV